MKSYALFAHYLLTLLGTATAVRITVDSYMPLSVEDIGPDGEGPSDLLLLTVIFRPALLTPDSHLIGRGST